MHPSKIRDSRESPQPVSDPQEVGFDTLEIPKPPEERTHGVRIFDGSSTLITGRTGPFCKAYCYWAHSPMRVAISSLYELEHSRRKQMYEHDPRGFCVPRMPSMHATDLARAIAPVASLTEESIRSGQKLREEMISPDDSPRTIPHADSYGFGPTLAEWSSRVPEGEPVPDGFASTSDTNVMWLAVDDINQMLRVLDL